MTTDLATEINYEDYLYDKTYTCPCCKNVFKETSVRIGRIKNISKDSDLFQRSEPFNPIIYDVVLCGKCGYAALAKTFEKKLHKEEIMAIITKITPAFKPRTYPKIHTVEIGIERLKLSLVSSMTKGAKPSEKAYTCIKIAWLYRLLGDAKNENTFIEFAYNNFNTAFNEENPPILGMDNNTIQYLVAELARKTNHNEQSLRLFGGLITNPNTPSRIKELAREQRLLILDENNENLE